MSDADSHSGTVLYLSPTKALAADQLIALNKLMAALPPGVSRPQIATCDGDTPSEQRRFIVDYADVVLTNPDYLHYSMLPGHRRWSRFLKNLRLVIIDEGHHYRGLFGSHVAQILRRLTRLVTHYGNDPPVFVVASATSADPVGATARLVGVKPDEVEAFTSDTAPQGTRAVALWQPPELPAPSVVSPPAAADPWLLDPFNLPDPMATADDVAEPAVVTESHGPSQPRRSAPSETAELLAELAASGRRTLAFTRSRRGAETIATSAKYQLEKAKRGFGDRIAAYRGGYLPEERRELERQIRNGEILGLASTNALELGVDISGLDAVLIAGWPGTLMSLWQQAGRAGRAGADGLVVFVARDDPLDQYLVTHPAAVF
jgi:DEAD/DEAH box helicase domain-containing protein